MRTVILLLVLNVAMSYNRYMLWNMTLLKTPQELSHTASIIDSFFSELKGVIQHSYMTEQTGILKVQIADGQKQDCTAMLSIDMDITSKNFFHSSLIWLKDNLEVSVALWSKKDGKIYQKEGKSIFSLSYEEERCLSLKSEQLELTLTRRDLFQDLRISYTWQSVVLSMTCVFILVYLFRHQTQQLVSSGFCFGGSLIMTKFIWTTDAPSRIMSIIISISVDWSDIDWSRVKANEEDDSATYVSVFGCITLFFILFFAQIDYPRRKYILQALKKVDIHYLPFLALLLYELNEFSITVFTMYHILVNLPARLKSAGALTTSVRYVRLPCTFLILAYLTYISYLIDSHLEIPYYLVLSIQVAPISRYTLAMIYLNGIMSAVFDLLRVNGIIGPATFSFERLRKMFTSNKCQNKISKGQENEESDLLNDKLVI